MTRNEIIDNSDTSRVHKYESEWEVSDFSSSGDSMDEWLPWFSRTVIWEDGSIEGS